MHNCTETTLSCSHCNLLLTYHTMIIVPSKKQSPIHLLSVPIKIEHTPGIFRTEELILPGN